MMKNEMVWLVGQPAELRFAHFTPTTWDLLEFTKLVEKLYETSESELAEAMRYLGGQPEAVDRLRTVLTWLAGIDEPGLKEVLGRMAADPWRI
jgi:hypothetical protein